MTDLEKSKKLHKSIKKPSFYTVSTYNPDDTVNKIYNQVFKFKGLAKDRFNDLKKKIVERLIPDTMICMLAWYTKDAYSIVDQYSINPDEGDQLRLDVIYHVKKNDNNISC